MIVVSAHGPNRLSTQPRAGVPWGSRIRWTRPPRLSLPPRAELAQLQVVSKLAEYVCDKDPEYSPVVYSWATAGVASFGQWNGGNPFLCEVWRFRMILEEVWHQGTLLVGRSLSLDSIDLGDPPKNCKMGGVGSFGSSFLLEFSWLLKVCVEPLSFFWGLVMRVLGHNFHLVVWIE